MSNGDKSKKQMPVKSKLFKLKKWLTVPDAARHLSGVFDEEVSEADVLMLALNGGLKLSVNFVNPVYCKRVRIGQAEDTKEGEIPTNPIFAELKISVDWLVDNNSKIHIKGLADGNQIIEIDDNVTIFEGVMDLPMIGGERLAVERNYQMLTGGPNVAILFTDGSFVENEDGDIFQIQELFDIDDYRLAGTLPSNDSVLVVRISALRDLQDRASEEQVADKPISLRAEKSDLHIIGALRDIIIEKKLFSSEEDLRTHIAEQYKGYPGCAERTLAGRFAEATKLLSLSDD